MLVKNSYLSSFKFVFSLFFLFIIINTSGCGGGGSSDPTTTSTSTGSSPPSLFPTALTFNAVTNGPMPTSQSILVSSYSGDKLTVTTSSGSLPSWLTIGQPSNSSTPFNIDINIVSTNLSPGTYSALLTFNSVQTLPLTKLLGSQSVNVTYVVDETLSVSNSALTYNLVNGSNSISKINTVNIFGGNLAWTATTNVNWIELSKTAGNAPDSLDINIAAIGTSLIVGTHTGIISVVSTKTSEVVTINVTLNVDEHRLHVTDKAVAFSSLPSRTYLSHNVNIIENGSMLTNWSASANANWLTLQSSTGTTNDDVVIAADPAGLSDGLYYASVTVIPDNEPTISNSEVIRVALYVSSTDAVANDSFSYTNAHSYKGTIVSDPLRPYIYVTSAGPDISIYNIYNKILVNTITIASGEIHSLAINSDGSKIYAANFKDLSIAEINLDSQSLVQTFTGNNFSNCGNCNTYANSYELDIKYDEPNGLPILISNSFDVINATTGEVLTTLPRPPSQKPPIISINPVSNVIYVAGVSAASNQIYRYELGYSYLSGLGLYYERTHLVSFIGEMLDMEVLADGNYLCSSIVTVNNATCFNTNDLTPWINLSLTSKPLDLEISNKGNIYTSYNRGTDLTLPDITAFDSTGISLSTFYNTGAYVDAGQLAISGDGMRLISRGGDSSGSPRTIYLYDIAP